MKKYAIIVILTIIILVLLCGGYYIYSSKNSSGNIKAKVDAEIDYLDATIVSMMNCLNNISYENYKILEDGNSISGDNEKLKKESDSKNIISDMEYSSILVNPNMKIDWNYLKKETEKMYQTWNTVLIDLNSLNINQSSLLQYNDILDNITKNVQKEEKKATLYYLAELYALLANYSKEYSDNNQRIILKEVKANILFSYALIEESKWKEMQNYIKKSQGIYDNIINSTLQNESKRTNINKAYILLNELYKSTNTKDKKIFYINYKNLMQELDIIDMLN